MVTVEQPEGGLRRGEGDLQPGERDRFGPIEAQVRADVDAILADHPMRDALAEMAFHLARILDGGYVKDLAVAGISKELRETLVELAATKRGDDDDLADALSVPTSFRDV